MRSDSKIIILDWRLPTFIIFVCLPINKINYRSPFVINGPFIFKYTTNQASFPPSATVYSHPTSLSGVLLDPDYAHSPNKSSKCVLTAIGGQFKTDQDLSNVDSLEKQTNKQKQPLNKDKWEITKTYCRFNVEMDAVPSEHYSEQSEAQESL